MGESHIMNELYISDTPYQIFNVLNIVHYKKKKDKKKINRDLYIINQFETAEKLYQAIKKAALFDNVYLLRKDDTKFMPVGMKRHIRMSLDFLGPKKFLKKRFEHYDYSKLDFYKYDRVYASGAFSTVAAVLKLNKKAQFVMYDDGLGSYSGNYIIRSSGGKLNRIFCKVFHVGSEVCKPVRLLVNNTAFCNSTVVDRKNIRPLPKFTNDFIELCKKIFDVKSESENTIYWLSQPLDCDTGADELRTQIRDVLRKYSGITVRMHPRDKDFDFYKDFNIETSEDLWELSILDKKTEELVLISLYSSAQLTPKLLFDLEPKLIFLYKLNKDYSEQQIHDIDEKIMEIKEQYNNPQKIFVPENFAEFENMFRTISNEKRL